MKNNFRSIRAGLAIPALVTSAFVASMTGVLPVSVASMFSFPALLGWFAAAGVIVSAFREYLPGKSDRRRGRRARDGSGNVRHADDRATAWRYRTISA